MGPAMDRWSAVPMMEASDRKAQTEPADHHPEGRYCGGDDRLVGMLMLELNRLACDACCLGRADSGAKSFLGMLLHTCLVLSGRVLDHLREIDLVSFPHAKIL